MPQTDDRPHKPPATPLDAAFSVGVDAVTMGYGAVRSVSKTLLKLGLAPTRLYRAPARLRAKPGEAPGLDVDQLANLPPGDIDTRVNCIDYGPAAMRPLDEPDVDALLAVGPAAGVAVRWLDVQGLGDRPRIADLARRLRLHPLVLEDLLNTSLKPKIEVMPPPVDDGGPDAAGEPAWRVDRFLVLRMIHEHEGRLLSEQVSFFTGPGLVVSVQQAHGDAWDPIRKRIANEASLLRRHDADFLLYALIDAIVDFYFPAVQRYVEQLDAIETEVFHGRGRGVLEAIHVIRHELMILRNDLGPTRDVVSALRQGDAGEVDDDTRLYLGDVQEHAVQALDQIEAYRDRAAALADTYVSVVSNRMNEVMKVLTIVGSIFIPLGFLAGVFGMNFGWIPWLGEPWGFYAFCGACVVVAGGMLTWFRHRKWI